MKTFKETLVFISTPLVAVVLVFGIGILVVSSFEARGTTPSFNRQFTDAAVCRNDIPIGLGLTGHLHTQVQLYGAQYDEAHGTCEVATYYLLLTLPKGASTISVGDGPGNRTGLGRSWQVTYRTPEGTVYSYEAYPWPDLERHGLHLTHVTRMQPVLEIRQSD